MKIKRIVQIITIILVSSIITGCSENVHDIEVEEKNELHIAAASDLRFAFEEIGKTFEEEKGVKVVFQFGSSGNLAQQIANGAPIDLFASANRNFIEDLVKKGDIMEETKVLYGIGRIVLAVNRNSNLEVLELDDLLSDEIDAIAIANPNHAPYGLAAKEALEAKGLWQLVEEKLVYGENVSQTLQFVETGNAPVGIIALSIAKVDKIKYTLIDEKLYTPLEQIMGIVSHSRNKELAKEFSKFVSSSEGRMIMEKYGFYLP